MKHSKLTIQKQRYSSYIYLTFNPYPIVNLFKNFHLTMSFRENTTRKTTIQHITLDEKSETNYSPKNTWVIDYSRKLYSSLPTV